jgi:hypothetical protein
MGLERKQKSVEIEQKIEKAEQKERIKFFN